MLLAGDSREKARWIDCECEQQIRPYVTNRERGTRRNDTERLLLPRMDSRTEPQIVKYAKSDGPLRGLHPASTVSDPLSPLFAVEERHEQPLRSPFRTRGGVVVFDVSRTAQLDSGDRSHPAPRGTRSSMSRPITHPGGHRLELGRPKDRQRAGSSLLDEVSTIR